MWRASADLFAVDLVLRGVEVLDERDDVGVRNLEHHIELSVLSRGAASERTYDMGTGSNVKGTSYHDGGTRFAAHYGYDQSRHRNQYSPLRERLMAELGAIKCIKRAAFG